MKTQPTYRQGCTLFKNPRLLGSEGLFRHIASNAQKKGLVVNGKKTTLLIISAARSYESRAHIYDQQDQRVDSVPNMKVLGFILNQRGDISSHLDHIKKKFRTKVWCLRELRKAKFSEKDLIRIYTTYLRPTLEYAAQVFHPMMSRDQTVEIERQQYLALKTIYGFVYSNAQVLQMSGLESLEDRRLSLCKNFALKTAANGRFRDWFPLRRRSVRARGSEEYVEIRARTDRRYFSPLFYYRRLLNEHRTNYDVRTMNTEN